MLYEFRNVTLNALLEDKNILFLIAIYLQKNRLERIQNKKTLIKNKNAYIIAISHIFENSI